MAFKSKFVELGNGTLTSGDASDVHLVTMEHASNIHGLRVRVDSQCLTSSDIAVINVGVICIPEGITSASIALSSATLQSGDLQDTIWGFESMISNGLEARVWEFIPASSRSCNPGVQFGIKIVRDAMLRGTGDIVYTARASWWETPL